jgi:hypothetical protein
VLSRTQDQAVVIEERFAGLPGVAHGGYVAGVIGGALGGAGIAVQLRRPAPIGRRLNLEWTGADVVELRDGETLLAEGARDELSLDVPSPVTMAEAEAAAKRFLGFDGHPVPGCLVCGTARRSGDGLRIFPGPVAGRKLVAAPWVPGPESADGADRVPGALASAALDCAQLWALVAHSPPDTPDLVVTAALQTRLERPVLAGRAHVLVGWPIARQGRARLAGAALFGPGGELCAIGRQTAVTASWGVPLGRADGQDTHDTRRHTSDDA